MTEWQGKPFRQDLFSPRADMRFRDGSDNLTIRSTLRLLILRKIDDALRASILENTTDGIDNNKMPRAFPATDTTSLNLLHFNTTKGIQVSLIR